MAQQAKPPRAGRCRAQAPIIVTVRGRITRRDLHALCRRLRALLAVRDPAPVVCDVSGLIQPDAVAVEALARMQLAARRLGFRVTLRGASASLLELLALAGLAGVIPLEDRRQAEQREEPVGVQEEAEPDDPARCDLDDL